MDVNDAGDRSVGGRTKKEPPRLDGETDKNADGGCQSHRQDPDLFQVARGVHTARHSTQKPQNSQNKPFFSAGSASSALIVVARAPRPLSTPRLCRCAP